eukprot:scaffold488776_cov20-Prasinocladus_malaysianus.AAC.1
MASNSLLEHQHKQISVYRPQAQPSLCSSTPAVIIHRQVVKGYDTLLILLPASIAGHCDCL